ncbi:MAG TPA: radical SAM protein [Gammaproteobacteria bacterium]|nr:radical SAM protein [Gammaproteobacteria bacterium]
MTASPTIAYPIGDRLYLSITDRCTLACRFCPKTKGTMQVHDYDLSMDYRPTTKEIITAMGDISSYSSIVFCGYGEPTLRLKVLLEVAREIKNLGGQVRINTDGLANLVNKRNVLPEMSGLIDSLSISLNAQNEMVYNRHCDPALIGSWEAMLEFLALAPQWIPEVTATAINGLEGVDIEECRRLAEQCGVKFRQRELGLVG